MKRTICFVFAFAVAILAISCSKKDEPLISITGNFMYDGNLESVLDNIDYYNFVITASTMDVTAMSKEHTGTFSYTRDKNKIKINPALGGKVSEATIVETTDGFGLQLDDSNSLFFSRK